MNIHKLQIGFFIVLISAIFLLTFFVLFPFFSVLFICLVFAIIFNPLHKKILSLVGNRKSLAATITLVFVVVLIVLPLTILGILLFKESADLYEQISGSTDIPALYEFASRAENFVQRFFPGFPLEIVSFFDVKQYAEQIFGWAIDNLGSIFSSVFRAVLLFFLFLLGLFYFFRDGSRFVETAKTLSPLINIYDEQIFNKIQLAVNSVVKGSLVIAIIQGILSGIGLFIFGVPSPVIWGFIAAIGSFIPNIGTAIVAVPAVLYLFVTGHIGAGIGLIMWATFFVGLVDNLLGPVLIERGINIHPFMILISVLGGLQFFGIIGFIAGPVVLALLFALLDIYPLLIHKATQNKTP